MILIIVCVLLMNFGKAWVEVGQGRVVHIPQEML